MFVDDVCVKVLSDWLIPAESPMFTDLEFYHGDEEEGDMIDTQICYFFYYYVLNHQALTPSLLLFSLFLTSFEFFLSSHIHNFSKFLGDRVPHCYFIG